MATISHTVYVCDRCETEYTDEGNVRMVTLDEHGVSSGGVGGRKGGRATWTSDVRGMDLCESCASELADHVLKFDDRLGARDE